ncbi:MAG TPA: FkbM family methyltransferase [Candidatus Paceibacterota bacterium]
MDILLPLKKAVATLPPSVPVKVYNFSRRVPGVRQLTTAVIRRAIPDTYQLPEGTLVLNKKDVGVCGTIVWGNFEEFETDTFRSILRPGMNVVDIGANIGYYTVVAASRVGPTGNVFSYEPDTDNAAFLNESIKRNSFMNVSVFKTALSNEKGTRQLFSGGDNKGLFSFADNRGTSKSVSIITDTLDNSLAALGWPRIDVIKMDIEGAEPLALQGMKETLKRNPHMSIFCECYPRAIARIGSSAVEYLHTLSAAGFELLWMDDVRKQLVPIANVDSFLAEIPDNMEAYRNILARR